MYSQSDGRPSQESNIQINTRESLNSRPIQTNDSVLKVYFVFPIDREKRQVFPQLEHATTAVMSRTLLAKAYGDMLLTEIGRLMWEELSQGLGKNVHVIMAVCPTKQLNPKPIENTDSTVMTFDNLPKTVLATTQRVLSGLGGLPLNFQNFVVWVKPSFDNLTELSLPDKLLNVPIAFINYGENSFKISLTDPYEIALRRLENSMTFFHELYAHVKMYWDANFSFVDAAAEHVAFGQTYANSSRDRLDREKPIGKFLMQLLKALQEEGKIAPNILKRLEREYFGS